MENHLNLRTQSLSPVKVIVDSSSNNRKLSDQVHGVFEGCLPVLALVYSLGVSLVDRYIDIR